MSTTKPRPKPTGDHLQRSLPCPSCPGMSCTAALRSLLEYYDVAPSDTEIGRRTAAAHAAIARADDTAAADPAAVCKAAIVKLIDGAPLHTHESVERLADSILAYMIGSGANERIRAARRVLTNGEVPPSLRIKTALKIL